MGVFSNNTEALLYYETYCVNCVHRYGCVVRSIHKRYNGNMDFQDILDSLIPLKENGENGRCSMLAETSIERKRR